MKSFPGIQNFGLAFVLLAGVLSCSSYGKIKIIKDEFKGSTNVSMVLRKRSVEDFGVLAPNVSDITFLKELKGGAPVSFKLIIKSESFPLEGGIDLDQTGFLKVDDDRSRFNLENRKNFSETAKETTKETNEGITTENTKTRTRYFATGEANIPPALLARIQNAATFAIRIYYKSQPITYQFKPSQLQKLKEFAAAH